MHSSVLYFTFSFLLLSNAAPSNFTISNTELIPCPYKVSATAAPDLSYIDIIYSTKGINPNSLASYGPGVSTARGRTKCYVNVDIDYPFTATRVRVAAIDVEGVSKLDRGITANVETSVMWGYAWSISNFTAVSLQGPSNGFFSGTHNLTSVPLASYCEFPPTVTHLHIANVFSVSNAGGAGEASGVGELGVDAQLKMKVYLDWLENCEGYQCKYVDRYGNVWYVPPYDPETCSD